MLNRILITIISLTLFLSSKTQDIFNSCKLLNIILMLKKLEKTCFNVCGLIDNDVRLEATFKKYIKVYVFDAHIKWI